MFDSFFNGPHRRNALAVLLFFSSCHVSRINVDVSRYGVIRLLIIFVASKTAGLSEYRFLSPDFKHLEFRNTRIRNMKILKIVIVIYSGI